MPQSGALITTASAVSNELENSFYVLPNFFSFLRLGALGVITAYLQSNMIGLFPDSTAFWQGRPS